MERKPQGNPNLPRFGKNQGFKRNGFLGPIALGSMVPSEDQDYATEYSIGDNGEMPSITSDLDADEVRQVIHSIKNRERLPDSVLEKADRSAQIRKATGQPMFAGDNESPVPTRHAGAWKDEYVFPDAQPSAVLNMLKRAFSVGKK
jgi:hypothetical protein